MYVRVFEFFVFCRCYAQTILLWATARGNCSATACMQETAAMPTNRGASAKRQRRCPPIGGHLPDKTAAMPTNRGASALGRGRRQKRQWDVADDGRAIRPELNLKLVTVRMATMLLTQGQMWPPTMLLTRGQMWPPMMLPSD